MKVLIGKILHVDGIIRKGLVLIKNGKIFNIYTEILNRFLENKEIINFSDKIIAPGYIDIHIHGCAGSDVMTGTEQDILRISKKLIQHGVTSFLPTVVTDSKENILRVIETIKRSIKINCYSNILGIHLEGPFINKSKKGAMNSDYIIPPKDDMVLDFLRKGNGLIKMITIAPEIKNAKKTIKQLKEKGVIISIGHSNAKYEQLVEATKLGVSQITHLFNAMNALNHRNPGIPGGALELDRLKVQVIADGIHIDPVVIKLIMKCKGVDKILLISDAIKAADLCDGIYKSAGLNVTVKDGVARLENNSLAGSTLMLDKAVQNLVKWGIASISDAIRMASYNIAESLGVLDKTGSIEKGKDADLVILDEDLNVVSTLIKGEMLYSAY